MAEIKTTVTIDKLEAKVKITEDKEDGVVSDRHLVTEAKIQFEGTPYQLEKVLWALRDGHTVDVTFSSPQLVFDTPGQDKEPVLVSG